MTNDDRLTNLLSDWLAEQPRTAPDQLIETILSDLQRAPQRASWKATLRRFTLLNSRTVRYSLVAGALVVALLGGYAISSRSPTSAPGGQPQLTSPPAAFATPTGTATPVATPTVASSLVPMPSPTGASPSATPFSYGPISTPDGWVGYVSDRYGFTVGRPPDWTVDRAKHDWTLTRDAATAWFSSGAEAFNSPSGDVRVSAWKVPFAPGEEIGGLGSPEDLVPWIQAYCDIQQNTDCDQILDRALPLCVEKRDCHPGLLVPFADDVQAFFTGGTAGNGMTVVAVWRPESDPSVLGYGGARQLLEDFLSTMGVVHVP